jgi:dCTP deaminase
MNSFRSGTLQHNHKVASVQTLKGIAPTYCLTAPETGNFALSNGIFVSNCGLIANTTPLESSWRGAITLEFSNASSTDCQIYANEGVVQLLFFEGEPCRTTYDDRRGKYQDQKEKITLPRV